MKILLIILFLTVSLNDVNAVCGTTCPTGKQHICTGERQFKSCGGTTPSTQTFDCPEQYYCVDKPTICEFRGIPACRSGCGVCNPTSGIACISQTTYAFCFGTDKPFYNITGQCDSTQKCITTKKEGFCQNESPSCESEVVIKPPPTPPGGSTPADLALFCRQINQGGKFSPIGDTTCKKYNYCYISRGQIMGKQYYCPGDTVFDCQTQQCSKICNNNCFYTGLLPPTPPRYP